MTMAFDENAATEWFASGATTGWIAYQFASSARSIVTSYTVTSSLDWPDTDPRDWTMEGSNGATWTVLDLRTSQVFLSRGETKLYSFSNATSYNAYRLNISANNGSNLNLHLAEVQLFP
jgi:alpha-L-fucosidase 2